MAIKTDNFRKWVMGTGIFNIVVYSTLLLPFTVKILLDISAMLNAALGLGGMGFPVPSNTNHLVMIHIVGALVVFLGIMLIVASFDVVNRTWFIFWEALMRIVVFLYLLIFVVCMNSITILLLFGAADLVIGLIYLYYIFTMDRLSMT